MHYYLLELQYLGFRFHGWQLQKDVKTVQYMLNRTLITVLGHDQFKTMGASRTDSMVSANHHFCQLALREEINLETFKEKLNYNLPQDIRILAINHRDKKFDLLNSKKRKIYHYYFSHGKKTHPFCAPFITNMIDTLDIPAMKNAAKCFEGEHNFIKYCYRGSEKKQYIRTIESCSIELNDDFQGKYFPKEVYCLKVIGNGFLRNQIRIMMGALFQVGLGQLTQDELINSLKLDATSDGQHIGFIAPASGLILQDNQFT
ncbi:MAG: tRNA pseudouridine(38-40) synthase TruA [Halobacteriovoraceae bacterium]|nr:tRNA pseudouridine(38-40) synthase TruA [Halobacteriovoraceae bacterium]|tara:strand:- start:15240 stop:16016 length:777 start_codon:yes stop_codon:yes gene_type:complete